MISEDNFKWKSQIFQESWPKRKETHRKVAIEECRVEKLVSKQTPNGILSNLGNFVSDSSLKMFLLDFIYLFIYFANMSESLFCALTGHL